MEIINVFFIYSLDITVPLIIIPLSIASIVILWALLVAVKKRLKKFEFELNNVKLQCIKDIPNINILRSDNYTDNLVAKHGNRHMRYEYSMGRNTVLVCLLKDEPFLCFNDEKEKSLKLVFPDVKMCVSVREALDTLLLNSRQLCHYNTSSPEPPGLEEDKALAFKTRVSIYHIFDFTSNGRCELMCFLFKDFYHPNKEEILQFLCSRISRNEGGVFLLEGCSGSGKTQFAKNVMEYVNTYSKSTSSDIVCGSGGTTIPCSLFYTNTTKILKILSQNFREGIIVFDEFDKMITHLIRDLNKNSIRLQLIKKNRAAREAEREIVAQKILESTYTVASKEDKLDALDKALAKLDRDETNIKFVFFYISILFDL